jgi:hypothetical protein
MDNTTHETSKGRQSNAPISLTPARIFEMPKKVLIALPPAMLEQVDYIAQCEHRTRSDLIREALRRYLDNFRRMQGSHLSVSTLESPQPLSTTVPSQLT